MITALALAGSLTAIVLSNKLQEHKVQQIAYQLQLEKNEAELKELKIEKQKTAENKKQNLEEAEKLVLKAQQKLADARTTAEKLEAQQELDAALGREKEAKKDYIKSKREELLIDYQITENMAAQRSTIGVMGSL